MPQYRIYYAVQSIGFAKMGTTTYTMAKGVQSVGINTRFNLENIFEIGQIEVYELVENIPDIEVTAEKVLDGYPPLYLLATNGSTTATLSGRANTRTIMGLSIYSDSQDSASGTPLSQCQMSGLYVSAVNYTLPTQGNCTESITLVGNNKVWNQAFTAGAFANTDSPLAITGSGGVNRREDVLFGEQAGVVSKLPQDIPGISSSGYNPWSTTLQEFGASISSCRVSCNLGREQLFELGRRGPFYRYVSFPVEVKCDFEVNTRSGDFTTALENASSNVTDRTIYLALREGLKLDLGSKNKLASVTYGGANAGTQGGNATVTYSYTNYNSLKVTHPQDPSGLS